jgi:hypothetical protein
VRHYTPRVPAADIAPTGSGDGGRVCPECGEPARRRPPTTGVPWAAHRLSVPDWSHVDGGPLCPVVGDRGYRPAEPAEPAAAA